MTARILHFGTDECNRLMVLRNAGYSVEVCSSLLNLDNALQNNGEPAAVVMSDVHPTARHEALALVRSRSSVPLILFQHTDYTPDESDFDLVVPNLTPTKEWLQKIAATIERSRTLHADLKSIHEHSFQLVQGSAATREKSTEERQRSARPPLRKGPPRGHSQRA